MSAKEMGIPIQLIAMIRLILAPTSWLRYTGMPAVPSETQ